MEKPPRADQFGRLFFLEQWLGRGITGMFAQARDAGIADYEFYTALHGVWHCLVSHVPDVHVEQIITTGHGLFFDIYRPSQVAH